MDDAFTVRNLGKWLAKSIVAAKAADLAEDALINHTNLDEDGHIVNLGSKAVGWYISSKLEPVTDKFVDKTADFLIEQRIKRQAKKDAKKN